MGKHLSLEQRYKICYLRMNGKSLEEIGKLINVHKSTVSRELRRNSTDGIYRPDDANSIAKKRASDRHIGRRHKKNAGVEPQAEVVIPAELMGGVAADASVAAASSAEAPKAEAATAPASTSAASSGPSLEEMLAQIQKNLG